ncbi:putative membrane protein C3orf80 homolog [Stigmatopora argus]
MPRRWGGGGGNTGTLFSACLFSVCQALRNCGEVHCGDGQQCCPPIGAGNGSNNGGGGGGGGGGVDGGATVRCCKLPIHVFFDNVGWFTRKLSGILILLLLFAMGYFIQRIVCPRPRRHPHQDRGEEPSLFHGHTSASQDTLLDRYPECNPVDFASANLPAYDEVKYLPTYEESMQEMHRDRSDDNLLADNETRNPGRCRAAGTGAGDLRMEVLDSSGGQQAGPRTSRNSV